MSIASYIKNLFCTAGFSAPAKRAPEARAKSSTVTSQVLNSRIASAQKTQVQRWRKAYGFQPADETFGTVTHASLCGKIVVLDIECALMNKTRLGVFEVPLCAFRQYRRNKRFQFDDVRQLIGRQVVLCIHGRYNFKGYYRSNVHGVKVFSKEASVARKAAAQEVIDPQNSGDENFDPVVAAGLAVA